MADFLKMISGYISKIMDEDFLENLLADKNVLENEQLRMELEMTRLGLVGTQLERNNLKNDNEGRIKVIQLLAKSEAEYREKFERQYEEFARLTAEMEQLKMENAELRKKASNDLIPFDFGEEEYSEDDCLEEDLSESDAEEEERTGCDEYVLC